MPSDSLAYAPLAVGDSRPNIAKKILPHPTSRRMKSAQPPLLRRREAFHEQRFQLGGNETICTWTPAQPARPGTHLQWRNILDEGAK
ncbi:MAG: hypothetical protein IPJ94_12525 [Chloroflexi bacterium]|nr:hypothetical protein [Chloroflexota bacterium]